MRQIYCGSLVHIGYGLHGLFLPWYEGQSIGFESKLCRYVANIDLSSLVEPQRIATKIKKIFHQSTNKKGSIMAVTNGIGALTGVAAPVFVGMMTPNSSLEEWRFVFWVTFVIFVVTTVVYSIWASGEVQPWNFPKDKECKSSEFGNAADNNNITEKSLDHFDKH